MPSDLLEDCGVRAAHRIQWRDRAGISPASRAQTRRARLIKAAGSLLVLVVFAAACTPRVPGPPAALKSHSGAPRRIVSLVPSLTEDLFALGAGGRVVAVTQADDYPPQVKRLPAVASFSSVNNEAIVRLHPEVVVGIPAQERLITALRSTGIMVVLLRDDTYRDIFANIATLGAVTARQEAAKRLVVALHAETSRLQHRLGTARRKPRVLFVINVRPIIVAGKPSFISALLALSGATNAADIPQAYPTISAEAVLRAQPDAIVTDDQTQLQAVAGTAPWNSLEAIRRHHVFVLDKPHADVVERPGPRYNEGIAWLILHFRNLR